MKKGALKNFAKFTGKHLCQSLFLNSCRTRLRAFIKKILWHSCFLVNFAKFLSTTFSQNTSGWLLLAVKDIFDIHHVFFFEKGSSYIYVRSSHRRCSCSKVFLKISQNSQENTCWSLFNKVFLIKKETPTQVFSCEFCNIFKNPF